MKMLYKYPQTAYPYEDLVKTKNHKADRGSNRKYELIAYGFCSDGRLHTSMSLWSMRRLMRTTFWYGLAVENRGSDKAVLALAADASGFGIYGSATKR